jgi:hypothetical protein
MFYQVANYIHPRVCQNFCHGSVQMLNTTITSVSQMKFLRLPHKKQFHCSQH